MRKLTVHQSINQFSFIVVKLTNMQLLHKNRLGVISYLHCQWEDQAVELYTRHAAQFALASCPLKRVGIATVRQCGHIVFSCVGPYWFILLYDNATIIIPIAACLA